MDIYNQKTVLGGGPAGLVAAMTAAAQGYRAQ